MEPREKPVPTMVFIIENCSVHPDAKDNYPRLSQEELQRMADHIEAHGLLLDPVTLYMDENGACWIIDGANRLEAIQLIPEDRQPWGDGPVPVQWLPDGISVEDYIDGKNLLRRHLTKEQYVERVAKRLGYDPNNEKSSADRSFSPEPGSRGGSTKDPLRAKLVEEAVKVGIPERTVKTFISKKRGTYKRTPRAAFPNPTPTVATPAPTPETQKIKKDIDGLTNTLKEFDEMASKARPAAREQLAEQRKDLVDEIDGLKASLPVEPEPEPIKQSSLIKNINDGPPPKSRLEQLRERQLHSKGMSGDDYGAPPPPTPVQEPEQPQPESVICPHCGGTVLVW